MDRQLARSLISELFTRMSPGDKLDSQGKETALHRSMRERAEQLGVKIPDPSIKPKA